MQQPRSSPRRPLAIAAPLVGAAILLAGCASGHGTAATGPAPGAGHHAPPATSGSTGGAEPRPRATSSQPTQPPIDAAATQPPVDSPATQPPPEPEPAYPSGIVPHTIEIPAIGVEATTIGLDLSGPEPEVPADFDQAGWYEQTRRPGEIGPAVIAGHIDSRSGPAVFARLDRLEPGDRVTVLDASGERVDFIVQRAARYPKGDLPREVFGFGQPVAELRLITCGGAFDRSTGHYRDNHVVYATRAP